MPGPIALATTHPHFAAFSARSLGGFFYLVTFGYIDGDFDDTEKSFVRETIRKLIEHRAKLAMPDAEDAVRNEVVTKFTKHFHEVFEGIDLNVKELFTESVSSDEDPKAFGKAISALGSIPLRMVSQAASRRNITFVLRDADVPQAMNRLHDAFFGSS